MIRRRESSRRSREYLIHRESNLGEYGPFARHRAPSGLRGPRDRSSGVIHGESGKAPAIPRYLGHPQSRGSTAPDIARYPYSAGRHCRPSRIPIHRESDAPQIQPHRTQRRRVEAAASTHSNTDSP